MSDTNPMAAGSSTTEAKTTKVIQLVAGIFAAVGAALATLHEQFPDVVWLSIAMNLVGGIVALGAQLGLVRSRTIIKATAIQQGLGNGVTSGTLVKPPNP